MASSGQSIIRGFRASSPIKSRWALVLALILAFWGFLLGGSSTALADTPLDCALLLGSSQSGELFNINPYTGSATLIGIMPSGMTEIVYDNLAGKLYAEESDGGVNLWTIDPTTGSPLGSVVHVYGALNGMEFVGSTLYATFITMGGNPSDLVIVDTATGNLTLVGPTGFGPISGLAYDKNSGVMYGITAGGGIGVLVTIDLTTGVATPIGPTGFDHVGSIEFGPDGNLYGGIAQGGSLMPNYLIRIDPATGAATPVGDTGFSITGLASCQAQAPVPTFSAWGMVSFALLLAGTMLWSLRRRQRSV